MDPFMFEAFAPVAAVVGLAGVGGWVFTTWLRVRHGYPLENSWGKPIHPLSTTADKERVKLIGQENAQLRAELSGVKDRLAVLERLVTDRGQRLSDSIEQLRDRSVN